MAINVVTTITTADVQRSLTAASLEVRAATTAASGAEAFSSSKGESDSGKKGDDQSKDQVNNNPNTNGKTDGDLPKSQDSSNQASTESGGKSGEKSGGVNIAASVAVNWARHTNAASIGNGVVTPVITAAGAVTVSAVNVAGANARAIGVAGDLQASTAVGAAIGLNVEVVTNNASIGADTQISAAGITVEAITPEGKRNDFVVWGLAAAGGKSDASVAGSVGIQVLTFTTNASAGKGAQLTSTEGIDVKATAFLGLQNLALAGGLSTSGTAVGGAAAINIFPSVSTIAMIDSGTAAGDVTVVNAAKKISVTARATLDPIVPHTGLSDKLDSNLPAVSSVAVGGSAGGGSAAVTGSFVVNIVSLTTKAFIGDGAQVNQTTHAATQSIEVKAEDLTTITNVAGALALNNGSAAVAVTVIVEIINKDVQAFIGKSAQVSAGPLVGACACDVDVRAMASENLFELAVSGGAGTGAAVAGSILVVLLNEIGPQATRAYIDENATVSARGKVEVNASDTANLDLAAGNIAIGTGSAGVGASAAILVRNGTVDAAVRTGADVDADGGSGLVVSASQNADVLLISVAGAGGNSAGVAGSAVVNVMTNSTKAHIDQGATVGGDATSAGVAVSATDITSVLSLSGTVGIGGTAGVGAGVDVEVINKTTEAWIAKDVTINATGNVTVDAASSEDATSIAAGGSFGGTAAVSVNAGVSVYNITTRAYVADGTGAGDATSISTNGSVRVAAGETLALDVIGG